MKLLFIGDIFGKPGRQSVAHHLKTAKAHFGIDFVIANAENSAHGFGITKSTAMELQYAGVDLMTGGNHTWDKPEISQLFDTHPIIRPLNYSTILPGKGFAILQKNGESVAVINAMGHFAMPMVDNPIETTGRVVDDLLSEGVKNIFIDFHAESTSEKYAFFQHFAGEVSAIVGTHTHVGTDDLMIMNDCGFVCDVGLTGCRDGVIGVEKEAPIRRLRTGILEKLKINDKCATIFQAIIFEIHDGICIDAFKIKAFNAEELYISQRARVERF
jgi:2',3'-cyclic-nucleotide 2'-phosphodiesterase